MKNVTQEIGSARQADDILMPNPILENANRISELLSNAVSVWMKEIRFGQRGGVARFSSMHSYDDVMKIGREKKARLGGAKPIQHRQQTAGGDMTRFAQQQAAAGITMASSYAAGLAAPATPLLSATLPVIGPLALLSAGGLGAAVAPWACAAQIFWDYRGDINANNLHDVISRLGKEAYSCHCKADEHKEPRDCQSVIRWLIDRKESNLALNACSIFLAGIPAMATMGVRMVRERAKRAQWVGAQGKLYLSPPSDAYWRPDSSECHGCRRSIYSRAFRFGYNSEGSRHHCRLCGHCYCTRCCSYRATLMDPLTSRDNKSRDTKNRGIPGSDSTQPPKKIVGDQLVCNHCLAELKQRQTEYQTYQTGPERMCRYLIENATPGVRYTLGCVRSQVALYCLARGDVSKVLSVLVARDGVDIVVGWTKTGVTKLPF